MENIVSKVAASGRKSLLMTAAAALGPDVQSARSVLCRPLVEGGATESEALDVCRAVFSAENDAQTLKRPYSPMAVEGGGKRRVDAPEAAESGAGGGDSVAQGTPNGAGESGWETQGDEVIVLNRETGIPGSTRIAAFDMDGCLIDTKSGAKFAKNAGDWRWKFPEVPQRLRDLHEDGMRVVIMSNQLGVSKGVQSADGLRTKISALRKELGFPLQALLAIDNGILRKPRTGMWSYFARACNGGVVPDVKASFYIGDAAGRAKKSKAEPKDHSAGDLKFAVNVGLPFKTPEHFFRNDTSPREVGVMRALEDTKRQVLNPLRALVGKPAFVDLDHSRLEADGLTLAVLVGSPGSGKSFIAKHCMPGFERVNQDTLRTKVKCLKFAAGLLAEGKSVVVDATNRDVRTRQDWVQLALKHNATPIAVRVHTPKDVCFHLNAMRGCVKSGDAVDRKRSVSSVTIHTFFKRVEEPDTDEGFAAVHQARVSPQPDVLSSEERDLIFQYLMP